MKLQLPRDKAAYAEYEALTDKTKNLYASFENLTREYKARVDSLKYADIVSKNFDIEGQIEAVKEEAQRRLEASDQIRSNSNAANPYTGTLLEPEWRTKAIAIIGNFQKSIATKAYPADFIFNVALICRMLEQYQLQSDLTKAAYQRDPASPPIRAMALSSKVAVASGHERDVAYSELMQMVANLQAPDPQIVLAEAWNAAEDRRRYHELINALDALFQSREKQPGSFVPSYAFALEAEALLRQSQSGYLDKAKKALDTAETRLKDESTYSAWYEGTVGEVRKCKKIIASKTGRESENDDGTKELERFLKLLSRSGAKPKS